MFLYACGVSRVHQEFELFEQILKGKIVLILKKKKGRRRRILAARAKGRG